MKSKKSRPSGPAGATSCGNCRHPLAPADQFCAGCGQERLDHRRPVRHLLNEMLEHFFHFDTKSWRTIKLLYSKPGALPLLYNHGRRKSFVSPLRFYLFASFLFFLLIPMSSLRPEEETKPAGRTESSPIKFSYRDISSEDLAGLSEAQIDELMVRKKMKLTWLQRRLVHRMAYYASQGQNLMEEFVHKFMQVLSYLMFLLMPWFAVLTFLLFRRRVRFFTEHLVFACYFHCFYLSLFALFKIFCLLAGFSFITSGILLLPLLLSAGYLFAAFRRMFRQGVWRTAWKTLAAGLLYAGSVACGASLSVFLSLLVF